ncbi:MAG: SAM-dependent methyltransferase [Bacteroidales bacterium]
MQKGTLYLLPALLGDSSPEHVIPEGVLQRMHALKLFAVENIRSARRFLIKSGIQNPVDDLEFLELNRHTKEMELMDIVMRLAQGENIGLLSESGTPCVADPGANLVNKAHEFEIPVKPLTGPSSILLGLAGSGFSGQCFSFHGYLPIDDKKREHKLRFLEKLVFKEDQTQIFIETPYRNLKMFNAILKVCSANTKLSIGIELTTAREKIMSYTIAEWKLKKTPQIHKKNVIFLIYK